MTRYLQTQAAVLHHIPAECAALTAASAARGFVFHPEFTLRFHGGNSPPLATRLPNMGTGSSRTSLLCVFPEVTPPDVTMT